MESILPLATCCCTFYCVILSWQINSLSLSLSLSLSHSLTAGGIRAMLNCTEGELSGLSGGLRSRSVSSFFMDHG